VAEAVMTSDPVTRRDLARRAARYQRVAAMRQAGKTFEEIGAVIERSGERARQILEAGPPALPGDPEVTVDPYFFEDVQLETRRERLYAELVLLTAQWRRLRGQLRDVDEELEARRIDRLLGLRASS
jgi:hypothetical protein